MLLGKTYFRRFITPMFLDILAVITSIWLFQLKFSSICIPKNLVLRTCLRWAPLRIIGKEWSYLYWRAQKLYNLIWVHLYIICWLRAKWCFFWSSWLSIDTAKSTFLSEYNKLVSSANKQNVTISEVLQMSLIYRIKSNGPNTEPCGTPQVIGCPVDFAEL